MACNCPKVNCGCVEKKPKPICDKSLLNKDAYLWIHVDGECKEEFKPFSFCCLLDAITEEVLASIEFPPFPDLSNFATTSYVDGAISVLQGSIPDVSSFVTDEELTTALNGIVVPDVTDFVTMEQVCEKLDEALLDYYTISQTDSIVLNLQTQLTTLSNQVQNLQAQLDACDCDGAGGETEVTPPTLDSPLIAFTDPVCPQCQVRTITNPDDFDFGITSTGDGVISASVNNSPVTDLSAFAIPDGGELEICLTGTDGEQVVGGVNLVWFNGNAEEQNLDGFNYNVTCPTTSGGNTAPTSGGSIPNTSFEQGESFVVDVAPCFSDADGDILTYSVDTPSPLPAGLTFNSTTGAISGDGTTPIGTYNFSVIANDGTADSPPCTTTVTVTVSTALSTNLNCAYANSIMSGTTAQILTIPSPFNNVPAGAVWSFESVSNPGGSLTFPTVTGPAASYNVTVPANAQAGPYDYNVHILAANGDILITCGVNTIIVTGGVEQ